MLLLALSPACVTGEVTRSLQSCKGGCSGAFQHWGGELASAGELGGKADKHLFTSPLCKEQEGVWGGGGGRGVHFWPANQAS